MSKIIVTGCNTDVGKTIVSAIMATALQGDYWKPISCGEEENSDSQFMRKLSKAKIHPSAYSLQAPLSPHHAARLEGIDIDTNNIILPKTSKPLVIETAGGIFVPLNYSKLMIDLFLPWEGIWVVVSQHYLGSINHTLLTMEALKHRNARVAGIIFNGTNPESEQAILQFSGSSCLGRLLPEQEINDQVIKKYSEQWKQQCQLLL